MVSGAEAGQYVRGVLMLARLDRRGFDLLDLTADGFWRSFAAIVFVLPALMVSWATSRADYMAAGVEPVGTSAGFFIRMAMIDIVNWIAQIILVGLVAVPLGIKAHFGRWVIVTNWLSIPISYAMALPLALMLVAPAAESVAIVLSLLLFAVAIGVFYRVTRLSFDGDLPAALVVTIGSFLLSFLLTSMLQGLFWS